MVKNIPGIILTFEIQIDFHLKTFYYVKLNPVTMKKSYLIIGIADEEPASAS